MAKVNYYRVTEGLLGNYKYIMMGIESNLENLKLLEDDMADIGALDYSRDKIDVSKGSSVVERKVLQFYEKRDKLQRTIKRDKLRIDQLNRAITELTEDQRNIIGLRYIDVLSWNEISELLNLTVSTLHRKKQEAIRKISIAIFGNGAE